MLSRETIDESARKALCDAYGDNAEFREGQLEAIEAALLNNRTLIVQKTGWGKSLVYFISTKILRSRGDGTTIIISPLLELMNNQIEAAERFDLSCSILNSTIKDAEQRESILQDLCAGKTDVFFTTPETLFKDEVQRRLPDMSIGMFVIDEAHCLSDWGHDFRREYSRLYRVIDKLGSNTPVVCTTATANDRVIEDIQLHLGENVYVSRGDLMRESLVLQTVRLNNKAERYAWIADHINELPGTGIIYCLTKRECQYLAGFLSSRGITVSEYYSDNMRETLGLNQEAIDKFKRNEIKAIVATVKLGMGYDKPDIGFVIHFQRPQNVVAYYQQIGRAGRNIPEAYAILMTGPEDDDILNHFIENAFPEEWLCREVLAQSRGGRKLLELESEINERKNKIRQAVDFLEFDGYLRKEGYRYYPSPKKFVYDGERYDAISEVRYRELEEMRELLNTDRCLLEYTVSCLNNPVSNNCGHCENCTGKPYIDSSYSESSLDAAQHFINNLEMEIEPRKRWPVPDESGSTRINYPFSTGICLSRYGDVGYGAMVAEDKYHADRFREELVAKSAEVLRKVIKENDIRMLTYVPSLRSEIVKDFARRLAYILDLEFFDIIEKTQARPQKEMENSAHQCTNARNSFSIPSSISIPWGTLLIDDIVDSRWTLAVCGELLGEHGCPKVIPFCLASSGEGS